MQDTFSQVLAETTAGDLCIDLGANIGSITLRMAKTGADVISFEPDPGAFAALENSVKDLSNVTLEQKAAGHEANTLYLHRSAKWSPDDPSGHTEGSSLVIRDKNINEDDAIQVEVVDILKYLEELDRDIRILKMDIEGAEWELLDKLVTHPVLARIDCIFVETHERNDPKRLVPKFEKLQDWAEEIERPYVNLYWV